MSHDHVQLTPEALKSLCGPRRERDDDADYDAAWELAESRKPWRMTPPDRDENGLTMYEKQERSNG